MSTEIKPEFTGGYCSSNSIHIAFNPIFGLDEDLDDFIQDFLQMNSPRFTDFSGIWRKRMFMHIIHGRQSQLGLYDILGCLFHRLVGLAQPKIRRTTLARICALYLMYAFYGRQPIRNHVRIRVCPQSWSHISQLAKEARDEGHLDVYYVFRKLCASNAFAFCAARQVLYPGAPLFDSPSIDHEAFSDQNSLSKGNHGYRRDLVPTCLPVAKALQSSSTGLNQAMQCLNLSISRYTEAKQILTQNTKQEEDEDDVNSLSVEEGEPEHYLSGLNLINFPGSLQGLEKIVNELEQCKEQRPLVIRSTKKSQRSSTKSLQTGTSESSERGIKGAVISFEDKTSPTKKRNKTPQKNKDQSQTMANPAEYEQLLSPLNETHVESVKVVNRRRSLRHNVHNLQESQDSTENVPKKRCLRDRKNLIVNKSTQKS